MTQPTLPVLVVDDQPAVVRAIGVLLDLHGIPHLTAGSPAEALAAAEHEALGAVVQDMNFELQETSGDEGVRLFHQLRDKQPGVPILLMTAWGSIETAVELVKEGASDYIEKPWDDDKLVATLRNLVHRRAIELESSQARDELRHTREELEERFDLRGLVYASEEMHRVVQLAVSVADSDAPVLITGPNGCGKERLAEIIQANSPRSEAPFVRVNVGAIPEELMESELFGAEPGAYTGLRKLRAGRFELADGGTLFLDEIDTLSLAGQVKLLRVLQRGEFQRLGSSHTRRADVRVLSATNADLEEAIADGRLREDLFFRLNVVELELPGLARRRDDVLPLARHFLDLFGGEVDPANRPAGLSAAAEDALLAHDWPGNVRELENRIRRATLVARGEAVLPAHLNLDQGSSGAAPALTDEEARERRELVATLSRAEGVVARAAEELGISRQALYRKMARLGVELERRPRPRD